MRQKIWTSIGGAIGMLLLILDTKTAISGAREAVGQCIVTVIPSLFPFFLFSILLTSGFTGFRLRALKPIGKLLRIPMGSEPLFLVGALGGYPTGAQAVTDTYCAGQISRQDAQRMLGFCNNTGPAFLFGIAGACFSDPKSPWILWLIHLLSAIITGIALPGGSKKSITMDIERPVTVPEALKKSIRVTGQVCGWIIIFRVVIAFLQRWFLWLLEPQQQVMIHGFLELTNGCLSLAEVECEGLGFVLCAAFLAFGGLCVTMQTLSVTSPIGMGMYLPGKLLQMLFSLLFAALYQQFCFPADTVYNASLSFYLFPVGIIGILILFLQKREKSCSNYALNRV